MVFGLQTRWPAERGVKTAAPSPAAPVRHRPLILAICCLSILLVSLDMTILNVALPSIQRDLHASIAGAQWTIDAYTLVLASLLLLAGSTADRIGRRRVFQLGLFVFTLGSLLCSLAPSLGWLIGFRMLQAVGGSMMNPVALSIISNTFTEAKERARAIGAWSGVVGVSIASGPVLGRGPRRRDRLALGVLGQHTHRHRRHRLGSCLRPGV